MKQMKWENEKEWKKKKELMDKWREGTKRERKFPFSGHNPNERERSGHTQKYEKQLFTQSYFKYTHFTLTRTHTHAHTHARSNLHTQRKVKSISRIFTFANVARSWKMNLDKFLKTFWQTLRSSLVASLFPLRFFPKHLKFKQLVIR